MDKTLEQVKTDLSQEYLGKHGIHVIGFRRSKNAIVVYVEKDAESGELYGKLRERAAPYDVIVVHDEAPKIN